MGPEHEGSSVGKVVVDRLAAGSKPPDRALSREQLDAELNQLRGVVSELSHTVYCLSHDLREPIRTVTVYAQLLKSRCLTGDDPVCKEYMHFIVSAGQRMDALANGILDYTGLLGSEALCDSTVDFNSVVQTALANLQMKVEEAHATVVHDELPELPGDFVQLTQLMQNLIGNAIKYRSEAPPQVFIKVERGAAGWLFSVEDNGIGIDPKYHDQLFVPFKRLHGREISGVGLGLAICRRIVERHGGRIWVDSSPGKTTFWFTLPFPKERS